MIFRSLIRVLGVISIVVILVIAALFAGSSVVLAKSNGVVYFPNAAKVCPESNRRNNIYADCVDQAKLADQAMAYARKHNKMVLVIFGANWCPPCWEVDAGLKGKIPEKGSQYYYSGIEAAVKRHLTHMKDNIVVLKISTDAPGYNRMLRKFRMREAKGGIPFGYMVDPATKKTVFMPLDYVDTASMHQENIRALPALGR